jgi:hypothetical protein
MDVSGDTFLAPNDALMVIDYINLQKARSSGGSGEGEGESSHGTLGHTTAAASYAAPRVTSVPDVLLASSSVVIEERSAAFRGTILDDLASNQRLADQAQTNQSQLSAEELALLALSGASAPHQTLRLADAMKLNMPAGPADEASWEELLASLAADQDGM